MSHTSRLPNRANREAETLRIHMYRRLARLAEGLLPRFFSPPRIEAGYRFRELFAAASSRGTSGALAPGLASKVTRIWFHAASVGELESLWTVIESAFDSGAELVVTVFSESAAAAIERLSSDLGHRPGRLLYAGYSPWEGRWGEALDAVRPDLMVTAKYEAWPELWAALSQRGVELAIVGARSRRSLRLARSLCGLLGSALPRLRLFSVTETDAGELRRDFGRHAEIRVVGDPRWDRVAARASKGHPRAREVLDAAANLPRPWGVLGSAWASDLAIWKAVLASTPGTLWVVPHSISEGSVSVLESALCDQGWRPVRTAGREASELRSAWTAAVTRSSQGPSRVAVLVNEMGFLSEIYGGADWAYVGGGFEAGVHSTIEPALQGLPVAIGPRNANRFPEIQELEATGELVRLSDSRALARWIAAIPGLLASRNRWREEACHRLGATKRVCEALLSRR